jgi:hypothetical protein
MSRQKHNVMYFDLGLPKFKIRAMCARNPSTLVCLESSRIVFMMSPVQMSPFVTEEFRVIS